MYGKRKSVIIKNNIAGKDFIVRSFLSTWAWWSAIAADKLTFSFVEIEWSVHLRH